MSWSGLRLAAIAVLVGAACLACGQDAQPERDQGPTRFPPGFKVESYRWTGQVAPGALIEARNPYGGFRSRTSPDDTVQVTAQIQKLSPDQPDVEFVIKESENGLIVTVGTAAFEMAELGDGPNDGFPGRVDLTVLVPHKNPLKAQTVDDDIIIDGDGMSSDVQAIARDGNITIATRGHAQATTGRGSVKVWLGGKDWSGPQSLRTTTGKIVVELLDIANLAVDAGTTGEIRTQFADGTSPAVKRAKGSLSFELGRGGGDLSVKSDSGVVELNVVKKLGAKL